jgi:alpha-beta hydrolase superfamily lysophospholipase
MPVPSYPTEAEARHEEGFLNSADHLRLYWQRYTPPVVRGTVAVLHGGGDHSGRYPALTTALVRAGFQVALMDLRGHGQSDGRRFYVDAFSDNLLDLGALVAKLYADGRPGKLFLLGHSHGGLVAALWTIANPDAVDGLVLSSPYLKLAIRPPILKLVAARLLGRAVPWLPVSSGIKMQDLTSDAALQRWTERDPLYARSTTPRWYEESTRGQAEALRRAEELDVPLLVLAAGADRIADVAATRRFVAAARATDKRLVVYDGFRHEIFNEVRREEPIREAIAWLSDHAGAQPR